MEVNSFVGTWRLVSMELRDAMGQVSYPFGRDALGFIMYTADGYMTANIMRPNRSLFAAGDLLAGAVEEQAAAAASYISYAGPYELREDRVIHRVEVSLFPNWVGTIQERFFEFADDRLSLSTAPLLLDGRERRAYLVWERATVDR